MLENPWIPSEIKAGNTVRQVEFLCYEGREGFFGGAAGPGKSVGILEAALQFIEEPGYHALILRRTFKQLAMADSILSKAKDWLWGKENDIGVKVRYSGDDHKFTFPNGNTLQFGHMEHEDSVRNYVGGIWAYIGVDEATQFTGTMLALPRTRQRRPAGSRIPMRWRAASNPGGPGHDAIKGRYIKDGTGKKISNPDRQFFPARIDDNPNIDREDYVKQLKESGVDPLTLAQMLEGDWDAVPGGRFKKSDFRRYDWQGDYCRLWPADGRLPFLGQDLRIFKPFECRRFLTVDPAASTSRKADYTVISAWCVSPWADLVWLGCARFRAEIPDIIPRIAKMVARWKPAYVGIEAIGANRAVYQLAQRESGMVACPLEKGDRDKLIHATQAIVLVSTGKVYVPKDGIDLEFPLEDVLGELVRFTGDEKVDGHDDVVDTLSYAAELRGGMPNVNPKSAVPKVHGGR